jgi:hypothetical protein
MALPLEAYALIDDLLDNDFPAPTGPARSVGRYQETT